MLLSSHGLLAVSSAKFWSEKVALRRSNLGMMSLHLYLVVNTRRDIAIGGWISLDRVDRVVRRLLVVDGTSIMWCRCFREQVVLVGWGLQVLSIYILLLCPRYLDLNIWLALTVPVSNLLSSLLHCFLFFWAVEVLLGCVHTLYIGWGGICTDKIYVLCWRPTCRSCSPIRCAVSISFYTFYQFSCFWINFGEWIGDSTVRYALCVSAYLVVLSCSCN